MNTTFRSDFRKPNPEAVSQ